MNRVYRYELDIVDEPTIDLPKGAQVLSVSTARGRLECWALVDDHAPLETFAFRIVGTGHPIPGDLGRFVGTVMEYGGALVFHVFESKP